MVAFSGFAADVVGPPEMDRSGQVFELWRQDDNGQRFLVATFASLQGGEARLGELTRALHKQTYWIRQRPESVPG